MAPNNRLTQQRVTIIPSKNMAFFDDDDVDDDDISSMGYSFASSVHTNNTANDTFALAEFLSTTSPDEFAKPSTKKKLQQRRTSRLLSKLRKRGGTTNSNVTTHSGIASSDAASFKSHSTHDTVPKTPTSTTTRKHIPLPEYHPPVPELPAPTARPLTQVSYSSTTTTSSSSSASTMTTSHHQQHQHYPSSSMRDSGVYSEVSDKDYVPPPPPVPPPPVPSLDLFPMPPPSIPAKSRARPRRPAPLPADVASAAIHAALRNVPEAALRRRSVVRQRHYQHQMEQEEQHIVEQQHNTINNACPHCRQHISYADQRRQQEKEDRRLSCPPALASGLLLKEQSQQNETCLRQMIAQLEKQLAEERTSRKRLEQAMSSRHPIVINKREQVAEERDRWKGESLWMQDRIASLPL